MPSLEVMVGCILVGALTCYVLFGGADFGAGIWTIFAVGGKRQAQRALIDQAIGPIWEANHVWLIIAVTILFTAFPQAFAMISVRLHIPLSLLLIAITLRGTAFAVRTHDVTARKDGYSDTPRIWRAIFAASSIVAPGMLGIILGAIASGRLAGPSTSFEEAFLLPWLAPFPFMVGLLTTAWVAYLAAVYLLVESRDSVLSSLFRRRAIATWVCMAGLSVLALWAARDGAPEVYHGLADTHWGPIVVLVTMAVNLTALFSLIVRRDRLARVAAVAGAVMMLWGWALAQFPYLVEPSVTIYDAAPAATLRVLLSSLLVGAIVLLPLLYYLYRLFKGDLIPGVGRL
jgi:cytochrome bd ubiquinol oxidase subunit II